MDDRDHGQCVADDTMTEYLEGSLDPAIRAVSEVHLVSCERCRDQLAFLMRVLQPEVTAEEAEDLQVIAAEWDKRKVAVQLPSRKSRFTGRAFVGLATAAVLLIGVVSIWFGQRQSAGPKSATEVVQILLSGKRPFEARMTGQPHRPIVRTRGPEDPEVSYGLLDGEMSRLSADSYEMGRFYLLQKDFSRAIPYLEMAERDAATSAAVHNDLGVAYLESGDSGELEKAEAEFLHASQRDPTFVDAVFNIALYYERTNSTALAQAQWKHYLELDSKSDWASEARERLQGLSR